MYQVVLSRRYKTALKRFSEHKNFDEERLREVVRTLARDERLDARYRDHQLSGEFKDCRECHIKDNLLLIYQKRKDILVLLLIDIGTHDDLFG